MLDSFANYFWTHPIAVAVGAIVVIIILIWMTGSGSRQRFITFKRTKETDQLARDLSRIAAALERIARSQETPTDYVGRPIPVGWEESISAGEASDEVSPQSPATANQETIEAITADTRGNGAPHESADRGRIRRPRTAQLFRILRPRAKIQRRVSRIRWAAPPISSARRSSIFPIHSTARSKRIHSLSVLSSSPRLRHRRRRVALTIADTNSSAIAATAITRAT